MLHYHSDNVSLTALIFHARSAGEEVADQTDTNTIFYYCLNQHYKGPERGKLFHNSSESADVVDEEM